ncbi:MAG: FAD-binding oxidoreductase [Gemmatimonadota bacterium]
MTSFPAPLRRRLTEVVGEAFVITDPEELLPYDSDGLTAYHWLPGAVVLPGTTEEVVEVVRLLHGEGIPVVPRGAGTGLSGGALARDGAVVVGTARLNRILLLDPENRIARVEPGVVNAALGAAAAAHGLQYAPDPSSQSACTLGGNVAENSGGPHCLKYGVTSRYVTGLRVVLEGGEVVDLGGVGRDPQAELDLVGAFVGSEGCFGIAVEIEVRLTPLPRGVRTLLGVFETVEEAAAAVTRIISAGLLPAALEIMDGASIQAVEESVYAAGIPTDAGAALVVEFDGTDEGLDEEAARAHAFCREAGARQVLRAADEAERTRLWQGRKKAFGAMGRIAPDILVQDATVPRSQLPRVLHEIMEVGRRHDLHVGNVFHAGDGNLHPKILFDRSDKEELERVERASKEIMRICVQAGGTITGEHGVGVDKRSYMSLIYGEEEMEAMRSLHDAFDPRDLFNPGKVVPDRDG